MSLASEIWSILTPSQRRQVLAAQIISLAMAFSTVTGIAAIAPFFAVLGEPRLIDQNILLHWLFLHGGFSSQRGFIVLLGVAFISLVLIANLINGLGFLAMNRLALRVGNQLQTAMFADYLSRPYSFHAGTNSATLVKNVVYESTRVTNGILLNGLMLVANLVTASSIVLAIVLLNPMVAIAMIAGLAGGYALIYLAVRNRVLRFGRAQSHFAAEQAQIVNEGFGAIKELIVLQVQSFFRDRFERVSSALALAAAHCQVVAQSPRHLMECVAAAVLVGTALVLGGRRDGVGPWLGQLTFLAFAAYRLLPTLQQVFAMIVRIRADRPAFALIAPDLRHARAAQLTMTSMHLRRSESVWPAHHRGEIRLNDVSFRYADDGPWALKGVSLSIAPQSTVGIVGANGSGKTTLVDLIAGLLVPAAGYVEVDGTALDDEIRAAWQAHVAYVPQNVFLLDASISQNIALGIAAPDIDRGRLLEAARLAQLDELITGLPQGFEHRVGERGVKLSGGQRQRIGIARALYREASVLLLDEATNALDGLTERELMATLGRLRGRYTTILIAHRMSAVRSCDLIFQLEHGKVIGSGTYDDLLKDSEAFRRMAGLR
ncbi:MAG TPA: ABC transporter ATP-binding protein [Steroidobacteraceae bacterium]|jgi:ABC-type multidrug transport system fused ATPase/permease subunit|nr:ABC transporter ATP-binding protein [Steroidobacteraceae bacterium]